MRLALTAGGTGGHILPALAVLDAVRKREGDGLDVAFFGPENRGERATIESRGIRFFSVPSAQVRGRSPLQLVRSAWQLTRGIASAVRALRRYKPDVIFSTGGYGSFPASVAARILRKPLVVYLPDVSPGWAVRVEKRLATDLATTSSAALAHLPAKKTRVTGYPLRAAFFEQTREQARTKLGLGADDHMVVVAGATQGAHAINEAVFGSIRTLSEELTVYHITGAADFDDAAGYKGALGADLEGRYQIAPFREDLPALMLAADLAIMRAGASVLGELPAAALPAILVPGTFAGGHQRDNARWLEAAGAAEVVEESELGRNLGEHVLRLLADHDRIAAMRAAAASLARPNAADDIAALLQEVAKR
ncbi:hypothetical protein AYO38_01665 [bacterium SCGC AG-212-C10]|nr:hypothetical protein AYO38_01665 [bacterium SCGC AG-212-C10]